MNNGINRTSVSRQVGTAETTDGLNKDKVQSTYNCRNCMEAWVDFYETIYVCPDHSRLRVMKIGKDLPRLDKGMKYML